MPLPKIIQILDVDSDGHTVRLSNGDVIKLPHTENHPPTVGEVLQELKDGRTAVFPETGGRAVRVIPMALAQMNSPEQVAANVLSEIVKDSGAESTPKESAEPEQAPAPDATAGITAYTLNILYTSATNATADEQLLDAQMNSPEQVAANVLSEIVKDSGAESTPKDSAEPEQAPAPDATAGITA